MIWCFLSFSPFKSSFLILASLGLSDSTACNSYFYVNVIHFQQCISSEQCSSSDAALFSLYFSDSIAFDVPFSDVPFSLPVFDRKCHHFQHPAPFSC